MMKKITYLFIFSTHISTDASAFGCLCLFKWLVLPSIITPISFHILVDEAASTFWFTSFTHISNCSYVYQTHAVEWKIWKEYYISPKQTLTTYLIFSWPNIRQKSLFTHCFNICSYNEPFLLYPFHITLYPPYKSFIFFLFCVCRNFV